MKEETLIHLAMFSLGLGVAGLWHELTATLHLKKIANSVEMFAQDFRKTITK